MLYDCHYCGCWTYPAGSIEALDDPRRTRTRDHTVPKCDGGLETVVSCAHCNSIKGSDPYDLFVAFMNEFGGRDVVEARLRDYRLFRGQIMLIGLAAYLEELEAVRSEPPVEQPAPVRAVVAARTRYGVRELRRGEVRRV